MDWYLAALRNYARFDGRARRKEYWFFTLFTTLIYIALIALGLIVALLLSHAKDSGLFFLLIVPAELFIVAMVIPSLSAIVRRLHDTGRSGWWYFISFVPLAGPIILLVFTFQDSQPGPNLYGPNPKGIPGFYQMPPQPPYYPPVPHV